MARLSAPGVTPPDLAAVNLSRLLVRLEKTLLRPDSVVERRLRTSSYERTKVGANLDYAKSLLLRLEQDATTMKVLSQKQEVQTELLLKRDLIKQLSERLEELDTYGSDVNEESSEGEDILGEDTPSASDDVDGNEDETPSEQVTEDESLQASAASLEAASSISSPTEREQREQLFPSELRARHAQAAKQGMDTAQTTSSDTAATARTEKLLDHNRTEQESLTDSLLSMAQQLKASSQAFSNSLESEKDVLGRATEGLDRNTSGLETAQKRMGYLRKMSEGKGWFGRMMLYAWIFGLMFIALFIVGFLPKLRF